MKKVYLLFFSLVCLMAVDSFAVVTVKSLKFSKDTSKGVMTINYDGNLNDYPELKINKNSIYVIIPDSKIRKPINKRVNFSAKSKTRDTQLQASQFTSKSTRVKVIFPFEVSKKKERISLTLRDNKIELSFPKMKANSTYLSAGTKKSKITTKKASRPTAKIAKDLLNEDYLNSLIKAQKTKKLLKKKATKTENYFTRVSKKTKGKKDEVTLTQSAPQKSFIGKGNSSFSLAEYGGKFVAFLGVVLLLFYGVMTLMKKGFIKKGKLGFLNKTDQVKVLSQTYIAPKKSLMLIQAHNQVFLVSNTDSGIHPISEIKDVAGLIKNGEKIIAGNNFDDSLGLATQDSINDNKIKLKEDIMDSNKQSALSEFITKDRVSFSDQLKKKVKGLKPLQ